MKIAQVAPLYESVPPKNYGGTERVVHYLTEELVRLGHEVTLYASGDSETSALLKPMCSQSLRLDKQSVDPVADHIYLAERVYQDAADYDVVHSHIDYIGYPMWRRMKTPCMTTLHGRLDIPNLVKLYDEFDEIPLISISRSQRLPLARANWLGTVYHGLPPDLFTYGEGGGYLTFLGRISPEKRADFAIEIAKRAGMPLKIAAKVDKADKEYFETIIRPMMDTSLIEFIGEVNDREKNILLGNSRALLFPIDWPEPFGLVMIEAMACGTPVITRPFGSVPEIMTHGVTGFIVMSIGDAVKAVHDCKRLDRGRCREEFEARFTAERMARDYVSVYQSHVRELSAPAGVRLATWKN